MPEDCVVDTDVLSYIVRGDSRAGPYQQALVGRTAFVSFMTVAELDRWSIQRRWGATRQAQLAAFLAQFVLVLPDRAQCRTWAEVMDGARQQGRPIGTADYAGVRGLRLVASGAT